MDIDITSVLLGIFIGYVASELIGVRKWIWSVIKRSWEDINVKNAERKKFNTSFNRLVEDFQGVRYVFFYPNGTPRNMVDRFARDLTETSPHLKFSVRKIAEETISHANRLFEQGPVAGDAFVDYLKTQRKKAIKKNWIWGKR